MSDAEWTAAVAAAIERSGRGSIVSGLEITTREGWRLRVALDRGAPPAAAARAALAGLRDAYHGAADMAARLGDLVETDDDAA
ncbi:MAG: hypothetical protein AAFR16_00255 [Pseudomonadota bacterium]